MQIMKSFKFLIYKIKIKRALQDTSQLMSS